jgi:outer membrane protein TolC
MARLLPVGLLLIASTLAGCCAQRGTCVDSHSTGGGPIAPLPMEMRSERGALSPDLSALASFHAVDQALTQPTGPVQYRVVRAEEVQCSAAANAPLAKLYVSESEAVMANANCRNQQAACLQSRLLALRAADDRNKTAGTALELFYSLAEAEANRDVLDRSIKEIDAATANLEQLKRSGLKIPLDRTALQRQKLDWIDQCLRMRLAVDKMQGQLQQLCGVEHDPNVLLWPQADLAVVVVPIDLPRAIADGLANRADLAGLRMLSGSLNADTLPAARSGMQALSPGLGVSMIAKRLFGGSSGSQGEVQSRQAQLAQAQCDLERTVTREVTEAVQTVETRLREIAVAKERWEVWRQRMDDLKQRRQSDGVTAFDLNAAQLELLRAESDTVHRVIAWKIAQAKLKQAQGLLAVECGLGP